VKIHPRSRGLVLLSVWVEPPLRDFVKIYAAQTGVPMSEAAANLLRRSHAGVSMVRTLAKIDATSPDRACKQCGQPMNGRHLDSCVWADV
jgi:hypothetical protein